MQGATQVKGLRQQTHRSRRQTPGQKCLLVISGEGPTAQMPKDSDCLLAYLSHSIILTIVPRTNWQNKHLRFFWEIKYKVTPRAKTLRRNTNYVPTLKTSNSTAINIPYHNVYISINLLSNIIHSSTKLKTIQISINSREDR